MQYQGFVKFIGPKETFGEGIEKQTIVLEENTGDLITVHLNSRANESKNQPGRWFNSITCWRIEKAAASTSNDELPF